MLRYSRETANQRYQPISDLSYRACPQMGINFSMFIHTTECQDETWEPYTNNTMTSLLLVCDIAIHLRTTATCVSHNEGFAYHTRPTCVSECKIDRLSPASRRPLPPSLAVVL